MSYPPHRISTRTRNRLLCSGLVTLVYISAARAEDCSANYTLAQVEQQALTNNPDLRVAREATNGAMADLKTAGERPNPNLTLSSTAYSFKSGQPIGSQYATQADSIVRIDQLFERGHKRALRMAAANAGLNASQAEAADQQRETLLAARMAFYDLGLQERKQAVVKELAELTHNSLDASALRQKAGDLSEIDLARLQVEAAKADNDVREAGAAVGNARTQLGYVLGCAVSTDLYVEVTWPAPMPVPHILTAIDVRPDVTAARTRAEQANQQLELAKAQATRDISIGLQYEHGVPQGGTALGGLFVSFPLLLAHSYEGEIARAVSDADKAQGQQTRVRALALAELTAAKNDLASNSEKLHRYHEEILPSAKKAADAIEYAHSKGALSLLDLLDARRTLRAALLETANAQADYAKALAAWRAATETYVAQQSPTTP